MLFRSAHPGQGQLPLNSPDAPPFIDVDGDGFASPLDVLKVVNKINQGTGGVGEGEGNGFGISPSGTATDAGSATVNTAAVDLAFSQTDWSGDGYDANGLRTGFRRTRRS